MGESVDVKTLRAKFLADMAESRDSASPKSPLHGLGPGGLLAVSSNAANGNVRHKPLGSRFPMPPRAEFGVSATPKPHLSVGVFPRPPPSSHLGIRAREVERVAPHQASEPGRVRQTGEMLRTIMQKNQGSPKARLSPHTVLPGRALPSQRSLGEVIPLRKPLPPKGPMPKKPKRPPYVNIVPYQRKWSLPSELGHPGSKRSDGSSSSVGSSMSLPVSLPGPSRLSQNTPCSLPRHFTPFHLKEKQDIYDDIEDLERSDSWNDNSSSHMEGNSEDSDVYESIEENQLDLLKKKPPGKKTCDAVKTQQEQKKEHKKQRKQENELRKTFQLRGEPEVLHVAVVRHDWQGGKLDLSLRQGDSVEILRVKDNPAGRWLARTLTGTYGYISNSCVDIDYAEVKRKVLQSKGMTPSLLPSPPPDPPQPGDIYYDVDSSDNVHSTNQEDEDDYDDVQSMPMDFPAPPPEVCIYTKMEKEMRKRFKFKGPLRVLYTMMVDPNGIVKRPGGKHLTVVQGEVLDVIQLTSNKKALCRNQYGKYGYVSRALLLQMEGDIYEDTDHFNVCVIVEPSGTHMHVHKRCKKVYDNDEIP